MLELFMLSVLIGIANGVRVAARAPANESPSAWLLAGVWAGIAWTWLAVPFVMIIVALFA